MSGTFFRLSRKFSSTRALQSSLSQPLKPSEENPHLAGLKLWKNLFIFVAIPITGLCWLNIFLSEEPERPEFIKYSYLRIRRKKYPWRDGVKSLFHNPHTNALPDGYEDQLENK